VRTYQRGLAVGAVFSALALTGIWWFRMRPMSLPAQYQRLPARHSIVLFIDFRALRHAGLLQLVAGSQAIQDPEYRQFVEATAFDYTRDLDSALVAFAPSGKYLFLNGRFDWNRLRDYALAHQGDCPGSLCRMMGSAPDRHISYMALRRGTLALAVSTDDLAVERLSRLREETPPSLPQAPVWLRVSGELLKSSSGLPAGAGMFAQSVSRAETITLSLSSEGARLAAQLEVLCSNPQDATTIASDLIHATSLLKDLMARERQGPSAAGLSGVLTSGSFRSEGRRVYGYWPIERQFLINLLSSSAG
jgi:hypothetical protein